MTNQVLEDNKHWWEFMIGVLYEGGTAVTDIGNYTVYPSKKLVVFSPSSAFNADNHADNERSFASLGYTIKTKKRGDI